MNIAPILNTNPPAAPTLPSEGGSSFSSLLMSSPPAQVPAQNYEIRGLSPGRYQTGFGQEVVPGGQSMGVHRGPEGGSSQYDIYGGDSGDHLGHDTVSYRGPGEDGSAKEYNFQLQNKPSTSALTEPQSDSPQAGFMTENGEVSVAAGNMEPLPVLGGNTPSHSPRTGLGAEGGDTPAPSTGLGGEGEDASALNAFNVGSGEGLGVGAGAGAGAGGIVGAVAGGMATRASGGGLLGTAAGAAAGTVSGAAAGIFGGLMGGGVGAIIGGIGSIGGIVGGAVSGGVGGGVAGGAAGNEAGTTLNEMAQEAEEAAAQEAMVNAPPPTYDEVMANEPSPPSYEEAMANEPSPPTYESIEMQELRSGGDGSDAALLDAELHPQSNQIDPNAVEETRL